MNSTTTSSASTFPRSVHEKYLGIVQLARTIDKAKMVATGTIGEYFYDCSMDQALFTEFGIDSKKLSAIVSDVAKNADHAPNIEAYLKPLIQKKNQLELERFNRETLNRKPTGDSLTQFETLRVKVAPDRTDVTTWPDLLDLEEGRPVPKRT
jgi:Domain of unknown function (DUF5069)